MRGRRRAGLVEAAFDDMKWSDGAASTLGAGRWHGTGIDTGDDEITDAPGWLKADRAADAADLQGVRLGCQQGAGRCPRREGRTIQA